MISEENFLSNIWDKIIEYNIASEETLQVITNINGYSETTLNDVIYTQTGYSNITEFERYEVY